LEKDGSELAKINLNNDLPELFKQYFASRNGNQQPNDELLELLNEITASAETEI